jgi:PTS system nitrogen regulatory IIA component
MKIEELLSPADVYVGLGASDKTRLLTDLCTRAATSLGLDGSAIVREVLKREALGSTGMGSGIAIPHARLQGLSKPFGLLALLKRPLDFEAIDGAPVDIVFLLLQPAAAQSDLNALAAVARTLRENDRLNRMREAKTSADLYRAIAG